MSIRAKGTDLATLEPQVSVAILLPGRLHSSAPAGERLDPDLLMSPHRFALWLVIFTVPMRPDTPFPGACRNWGSICAIRGPFVPLWGQIMGLGFGKWKHSPEMWSELGPHSTSFLCFVPRKETWLGLGVPRTGAEDTVRQRQARNRHSLMPAPVFVQNSPRKNRERNDPALSLLPKQGNSRHSELPFDSQIGGLSGLCCRPPICFQK